MMSKYKNCLYVDIGPCLEEIKEREIKTSDGYKLIIKKEGLYIIKNGIRFDIEKTPYVIVDSKKYYIEQ